MNTEHQKTALVVEGGGMRGIFTAGVLDAFSQAAFDPFDLYFGVSVGASTLSSFLAGQVRRHYRIFTEIACRPEFMSLKRLICGGSYMDLNWLWDTVESRLPLDTDAIDRHLTQKRCFIVCTDAHTGEARYLSPRGNEWLGILKASSALPLLYRPFPRINGSLLADGGVADPIPVLEAYNRGARHIVIIRTRPVDVRKTSVLGPAIGSLFFKNAPCFKEEIRSQSQRYNDTLDFMASPPDNLTLTQIAPQQSMKTRRTSNNSQNIVADYHHGVSMGLNALDILNRNPQHDSTN